MVKCVLITSISYNDCISACYKWKDGAELFEFVDNLEMLKSGDDDFPILRVDVAEDKKVTTSLTFRDKNVCVVFDDPSGEIENNIIKSLDFLYSKLPKFLFEFRVMYSDFPKPKFVFTDLLPIFESNFLSALFVKLSCDKLNNIFGKNKIDYIVGLEARGFIIGGLLASKLGCGFVPIRKAGKLPGEIIKGEYVKNYGVDTFEMSVTGMKHHKRIIIVDDILATGGSIDTTIKLLKYFNPLDIGIFVIADIEWRAEVAKEVLGPHYDKVIVLCK